MIIYQVIPSRLYPIIIESILQKVYLKSDQFWSLFEPKEKSNIQKKSNILNEVPGPFGFFVPEGFKYASHNGFVYGAFSLKHFNIKKQDFVFSIMSHPVDHIYELYARREFLINDYKKNIINYKENTNMSIKEFIDEFLEKKEIIVNFNGISYKMIDEAIFQYKKNDLNYIGKISNLQKVFEILSEVFNTKINLIKQYEKYNSYQGEYYRRKDVEILLKEQLDFYYNLN